jgi:hypothetical protein
MVPLLPKKLIQKQSPQPVFEIKNAGDKGAGMFATQDIAAGALILVEHPVIIVPASFTSPDKYHAFKALYDHLSSPRRQELLTMANCRSLEECSTIEEGIAQTNGTAIGLTFPPSMNKDPNLKEYGGVFLTINRSNHRCASDHLLRPNLS